MVQVDGKWKVARRGKGGGVVRGGRVRGVVDEMPGWVEVMKAVLVEGLPKEGEEWGFEFKWDGVRALAFYGGGRGRADRNVGVTGRGAEGGTGFHLYSRNHKEAGFRYPEIVELGAALGSRRAILDGEIVAVDEGGRPSFPMLQKRMNVTRTEAVKRAAREVPVVYMIFDVLYLDGKEFRGVAWGERREVLEGLAGVLPPACRLSPVRLGRKGGEEMLQVAEEKEMEGVIAKRVDSVYEAGLRTGAWRKIKLVQRQELVIGGWVPEVSADGKVKGGAVGAILLGYFDSENADGHGGENAGGAFHFAGAVGTGFTREGSEAMVKRLKGLEVARSRFDEGVAIRKFRAPVRWVRPEVVVEVEYRRWPEGGLMHQAAFKGVREDKRAKEVVRERPAENPE